MRIFLFFFLLLFLGCSGNQDDKEVIEQEEVEQEKSLVIVDGVSTHEGGYWKAVWLIRDKRNGTEYIVVETSCGLAMVRRER